MFYCDSIDTPAGRLYLTADEKALLRLTWDGGSVPKGAACERNGILDQAVRELTEYFAGERTRFNVPVRTEGTPFQQAVWKALETIPYGQTRTYGELARLVGKPNAARAIGMANHSNPVAIIIPCHRVIGANGKLTGFAGGLSAKEYLISLERTHGSRAPILASASQKTWSGR